MRRRTPLGAALPAALALALACTAAPRAAAAARDLILATTTSTQDSGLLDALNPAFEERSGYFVKTIAVGSGQAMAMGARGEADILLVHSPAAEERFMAEGHGAVRRLVMHNDFVVVGPAGDPAGIRGASTAAGAFGKVAAAGALFLSRGDRSGTSAKELALWEKAGIEPEGRAWYQQTGLGMGRTLSVASEKRGYTLADRATYLALRRSLDLEILVEGAPGLLNRYHVLELNAERFPKINAAAGKAYADFLLSEEAQRLIASYGVEKYGSPLFFPDAGQDE